MSILKHISYDLTATGSQQETVDDSAIIFSSIIGQMCVKGTTESDFDIPDVALSYSWP